MYAAPGMAFAAIQVNKARRVIVVDTTGDLASPGAGQPRDIEQGRGSRWTRRCLCPFPASTRRCSGPKGSRVRALDRSGEPFEMDLTAFWRCVQRKSDHLDGKLFVGYLSSLKRQRIRKSSKRTPVRNLNKTKSNVPSRAARQQPVSAKA